MAVSPSLRRLFHVRQLEEEQCRAAVESALGEMGRLKNALSCTAERDRRGRALVLASAHSGELLGRIAGMEETRSAALTAKILSMRIKNAALGVADLRQTYLAKRLERRQVEALIEEAKAQDEIEASRRGQQALDEWHRSRRAGGRESEPRRD